MKLLGIACHVVILLASLGNASGQSFANLNFENTTITGSIATLPGWGIYGFPYGNPTSIYFNTIALDAPAVTLHGVNSPFYPAIQGSYSVLLQGGTISGGNVYNTNGASIYQTGQIPLTSQSLIYLGSSLQVTFNGQTLSSVAIGSTTNYTAWGVNITPYAGQTGELRFTTPWQSVGIIDGILFSPTPVPEPNALGIFGVGILLLFWKKTLSFVGVLLTVTRRIV
ncbi:MAG: hypothetical protein ABIR24_01455 [Verrucomicrobiota bacterium]